MTDLANLAGVLGVDGQGASRDDVRAALSAWLTGTVGLDAWDADEIVTRARIDRAWWSDDPEVHFGHDCSLHSPGEALPACAGMRPVIVVERLGQVVNDRLATSWASSEQTGAIPA